MYTAHQEASRTENGSRGHCPCPDAQLSPPPSHLLGHSTPPALQSSLSAPVTWPSPFLPAGEAVWPSAQEAASRWDSLGLSLSPHLPSGFLGPVIFNHPAFLSSSAHAGNGTLSRRGLLGRLNEMMFTMSSPQRPIRDMGNYHMGRFPCLQPLPFPTHLPHLLQSGLTQHTTHAQSCHLSAQIISLEG